MKDPPHDVSSTSPAVESASLPARTLIAVTGAQGVGKSTFCRGLRDALSIKVPSVPITLLEGLGGRVRGAGYDVGSGSTKSTVRAVFEAHAGRQESLPAGYVIVDRCAVDALAYARHLGVLTRNEIAEYEDQARVLIAPISFIVHLVTSSSFEVGASHETPELRSAVGAEIPIIIAGHPIPKLSIDAAASDSVSNAVSAILALKAIA